MREMVPLGGIPVYMCKTDRILNQIELKTLSELSERTPDIQSLFLTESDKILELQELSGLKEFCFNHLTEYTKNTLKIKQNFKITDSWATRTPFGKNHHTHSHANSAFSGVYYANAKSGNLVLEFDPLYKKDFNFSYDLEEYNIFNSAGWEFGVSTGLVIIFPSWVKHYTKVNIDSDDRIIVGFNSFVCDTLVGVGKAENLTIQF